MTYTFPFGLWLALGVFGLIMFLLWAIVLPEFRVYLTSGLAFGTFGVMALVSTNVAFVTDSGTVVRIMLPSTVTFLVGALSVLSGVVMLFDVWGIYPPESENELGEVDK